MSSLPASTVLRHRELPETAHRMARADVRKAEMNWRTQLGAVVLRVQGTLSLKEFAALLGRDERQIKRWLTGDERPQFDVLFAVEQFRQPLVVELAKLAGAEVETQIRVKHA